MDQLPDLLAQLAACPVLDGSGATYEIAGDLVLPDGALLQNVNLIQLAPGATRKSISKTGGWIKGLKNVSVHRGTDKSAGNINTSAGIYLCDVAGVEVFDEIDVTGDGKGCGIQMLEIHGPRLGKIRVHDMAYAGAATQEQIFGVWMNQCSDFQLDRVEVNRLGSDTGRFYQTDGVTVSGSVNFSITRPQISFCGEGIDLTGSVGNSRFEIIKGEITDCDAFSLKLANSASNGLIRQVKMARAGFSDFVASGPSQAGIARIENVTLYGCESLNPGNDHWAASNITGFSIMTGSVDTSYPKGFSFLSCTATDTRPVKRMKWGFRNDCGTANRMANCTSTGHAIASVLGTFAYG